MTSTYSGSVSSNRDGNSVKGQSKSLKHFTFPGSTCSGSLGSSGSLDSSGNCLIWGVQQYLRRPGSPQRLSGSRLSTRKEAQNLRDKHSVPGGHSPFVDSVGARRRKRRRPLIPPQLFLRLRKFKPGEFQSRFQTLKSRRDQNW